VLEWNIENEGKMVLEGRETLDVPAWNPRKVKQVDLSSLSRASVATVSLRLSDSNGNGLCSYEQEFYLRAYRPKFRPEGEWLRPNERRRRGLEQAESVP
jgi:hypothetical protein